MTRVISETAGLLPQEPFPVSRRQEALTARFLLPSQQTIFDYLLALRLEADKVLSVRYPFVNGKPYPLGRCKEISDTVRAELTRRIQRPVHPAERAIHGFLRAGGIVRPVWGILRRQFFQNATQFGSLYIDVSNDTVTVTKPKVEILPMADSELEPVRDLADFALVAGRYWKADMYANMLVPALAPILPLVGVWPGQGVELQSATDYVIGLMMRDRFQMAEDWLRQAPPPPEKEARAFLDNLPAAFRLPDGTDLREAAIAACRTARQEQRYKDVAWRDARVMDFQVIFQAQQAGRMARA